MTLSGVRVLTVVNGTYDTVQSKSVDCVNRT